MRRIWMAFWAALAAAVLTVSGCAQTAGSAWEGWTERPFESLEYEPAEIGSADFGFSYEEVPEYSGDPYVAINGNIPYFTEEELTDGSFEYYGELDQLGRCTLAFANLGPDTMPAEGEERGQISQIKPTGWQSVRYDIVSGGSLYNRCHCIAWALSAENANERNLITGTRYMNVEGMLPFESLTADYIRETGNHVLYRVTPVFVGDELVARGVRMEAKSVEDGGDGVLYHVFVYNIQPGIEIDYATGESRLAEGEDLESGGEAVYILNTSSRRFHQPDCGSVKEMKDSNRETFVGSREELLEMGYQACGRCEP